MARAEQATGTPVLSIVVATTHPWPEMERTLDSLWGQAMALGAEVLLLDGHGEGLPPDLPARYPGAIRLTRPGASVFALRALGLRAARGEIIAMTEDHCVVPPDWCRRLLDAHRRYPHAAAVGGAVDNGATARLIDWANYFVAHSPTMAPIRGGEAEMISAQAGMAVKRRAIAAALPAHGLVEMLFLRALRDRGEILVADAGILVHHVQSHGFWKSFAIHYHNGRSIAGFRRPALGPWGRMARLAGALLLPGFLPLRAAAAVLRKRRFRRELLLSAPLIVALACCHAAGEIVGSCAGPGTSPERLS